MTDKVNLVRASEVSGLPVVTISEGEDAAEIKDVVYDAAQHHLIGFTLNKRGWFRGSLTSILIAEDVSGIGANAVMVPSAECMTAPAEADEALAAPNVDHDVIGNEVVSASGALLGKVKDVIIETGSNPHAVGYEVDTANGSVFVPSSAQMALSGENLIVPTEAEQFTNDDLAGFGASVSSFRQVLGEPS